MLRTITSHSDIDRKDFKVITCFMVMPQEFLEKVRPALEFPHTYSSPKKKPSKEEVRQAAEKAIKEIRVYGFEVQYTDSSLTITIAQLLQYTVIE